MADYYPLVSRAISELEPGAPGERRRAIYERARAALIKQLRAVQPPLEESEVSRERLLLEEAIRIVESEAANHAREVSRGWPSSLKTRKELELANQRSESTRLQAEEEGRLAAEEVRFRAEAEGRRAAEEGRLRAEEDRVLINRRAAIPPVNVIPEQNLTRAIGFSPSRRGPLDLVNDPPTDPHDLEQSMLYSRIRQQLEKLKDDVPNQERTQVNAAINDFLNQPSAWSEVEYKKVLWLNGNVLRALLAQHDAVRGDPEHYSKLPPSVAEALRNPIQAWSIFVQGDPALAELDRYSLGPQEQRDVSNNLVIAKEVISKATSDRTILTQRAADTLSLTMKTASSPSSDINTKLTQEIAEKTSRNLLSAILRRAYLHYETAIRDPSSQAANDVGDSFIKGATQAVGVLAVGAAASAALHALPYFEFVATNPTLIKEYILVVFQNSQMTEIVDALAFEYQRMKKLIPKQTV